MRKILITGAGTLIGGEIVKFLAKKGFLIIGIYNKSVPKLKHKKVTFIKKNLAKKLNLKTKFDYLIHCASKIPSDGNTKKVMSANITMLKNLLNIDHKKDLKKIIFLSTMSVYGQITNKIINEKTLPKNLDPYGKSKLDCEKYIKNKLYKKVSYTILRLPGVVGKKSKHNFMSNLVKNIKKNKRVKITNANSYFNNIVHVETISNLILHSINYDKTNNIYNVSSSKPVKLKDCVKILFRLFRKKVNLEEIRSNNRSFMISTKKIKKRHYPIISTKQSLKKFYESNKK